MQTTIQRFRVGSTGDSPDESSITIEGYNFEGQEGVVFDMAVGSVADAGSWDLAQKAVCALNNHSLLVKALEGLLAYFHDYVPEGESINKFNCARNALLQVQSMWPKEFIPLEEPSEDCARLDAEDRDCLQREDAEVCPACQLWKKWDDNVLFWPG